MPQAVQVRRQGSSAKHPKGGPGFTGQAGVRRREKSILRLDPIQAVSMALSLFQSTTLEVDEPDLFVLNFKL